MIGQTLSHFKITAKLGEGGMGEVYRAEDTKLGREVAIKVLPEAFTEDEERLARFEREARVLASVNHPNIAAIYEVDEAEVDGSTIHFLAMELAPGVELGERLERGPIGVDEVVSIARQIAEGLQAAHEQGIIHRDLKPGNIKVAPDGGVKILDFGLAKAWQGPSETSPDITASPTLTAQMTQAGMILGTAAYMSPEQARGEEADQRADVWSFGVILWEMLTGQRLFKEPTVSDTLAAVLRADLDLDDLPRETTWNVRRTLERCLTRDSKNRFHSIADASLELTSTVTPPASAGAGPGRPRMPLLAAVAAVALAAGTWAGHRFLSSGAPTQPMTHLSIPVVDIVEDTISFDIAKDGRSIVYSGGSPLKIYHRRFDRPDSVAIPGTEGGRYPVISPDGQSVVFHVDTAIKRVPLAGGTPQAIHPQELIVSELAGGAWASDGTVYISTAASDFGYSTILAFPEQGGAPRVVIPMADEAGKFYERLYPQLLPGEEQLLYVRVDGDQLTGVEVSNVMVLDLETGVETMILPQHGFARYLPSGHLLAASGADHLDLMPFDLDSKTVAGPSVPIQKLIRTGESRTGALFEVAPDGTVVFARASLEESGARLAWLGLDGQTTEVPVPPRRYGAVSLSPDSSKAVVTVGPPPYSLWVYDFRREVLSAVTSQASSIFSPIWMPTGNRIALKTGGDDDEPHGISLLDLDSAEPATRLAETGTVWTVVWDVSPDGKTIATFIWDPVSENDWDIVLIPTDGSTEPILFSSEDSNEDSPRFAPNGQWIAFTSDRSGIDEIYLRRYPEQGPLIQVSSQGATMPFWGLDGSSLYFVALGTFDLMKVDLNWQGELSIGPVQKVFTIPPGYRQYGWQPWASGLSEERGLLVIHNEQQVIESLDVILGWATELERMAPTKSK